MTTPAEIAAFIAKLNEQRTIVNTRMIAQQEIRSMVRSNKRIVKNYGPEVGFSPAKVAEYHRMNAENAILTAKSWEMRGNRENAVRVMLAARAQLIIARHFERMAAATK